MTQEVSQRVRRDAASESIKFRLRTEIDKLESQLSRLQHGKSQHRIALMETYRSMINTRADLLKQVENGY